MFSQSSKAYRLASEIFYIRILKINLKYATCLTLQLIFFELFYRGLIQYP